MKDSVVVVILSGAHALTRVTKTTMALVPGTAVRSIDNPARQGVVTNSEPRTRPSGIAYSE